MLKKCSDMTNSRNSGLVADGDTDVTPVDAKMRLMGMELALPSGTKATRLEGGTTCLVSPESQRGKPVSRLKMS